MAWFPGSSVTDNDNPKSTHQVPRFYVEPFAKGDPHLDISPGAALVLVFLWEMYKFCIIAGLHPIDTRSPRGPQ